MRMIPKTGHDEPPFGLAQEFARLPSQTLGNPGGAFSSTPTKSASMETEPTPRHWEQSKDNAVLPGVEHAATIRTAPHALVCSSEKPRNHLLHIRDGAAANPILEATCAGIVLTKPRVLWPAV
ncbi:hypothetical protein VM1G_11865 [Cytospora mali]|uniref:Uncharacterized protein n=1 Tax=Cytospora mali TaxID=578113 RepID=A0A194WAE0_CYTMA|nr:hypothetical protein VM1G_11865 [Valsa mali]